MLSKTLDIFMESGYNINNCAVRSRELLIALLDRLRLLGFDPVINQKEDK